MESWGAEWLIALLPMVLRRAEGTEVDGGGSEGAGRGGDLEEVTQIWWGEVMHGLDGEQEDNVVDSLVDWEPVELPQNVLG